MNTRMKNKGMKVLINLDEDWVCVDMYNPKFIRVLDELVNVTEIVKVRKTVFNHLIYIYITMKDSSQSRKYDYTSESSMEYDFRYIEELLTK